VAPHWFPLGQVIAIDGESVHERLCGRVLFLEVSTHSGEIYPAILSLAPSEKVMHGMRLEHLPWFDWYDSKRPVRRSAARSQVHKAPVGLFKPSLMDVVSVKKKSNAGCAATNRIY
jgi:hypothetical protein